MPVYGRTSERKDVGVKRKVCLPSELKNGNERDAPADARLHGHAAAARRPMPVRGFGKELEHC